MTFTTVVTGSSYMIACRAVQLVLAIITLGLSARVINGESMTLYGYTYHLGGTSRDNFVLFCSIVTMLYVPYISICSVKFPHVTHPFASFISEWILMIFWFAAFVAVADLRAPGTCGGVNICQVGKAEIAFSCFSWVAFVVSLVAIMASFFPYLRAHPTSSAIFVSEPVGFFGLMPMSRVGADTEKAAAPQGATGDAPLDDLSFTREKSADKASDVSPAEASTTQPTA